MTNINDREAYKRANPPQPSDQSGYVTGSNETNIQAGSTLDQQAYRDGYVHGQDIEHRRATVDQEIRDNDNAVRGLLLGILLTGLVGLATAAYFLTQRNQADAPQPANPTIVTPRTSPSPSPQQSPQVRERVIERDRIVPVPQQPAPAPDVNITVPNAAPQAPATQSAPTAPSTQSTTPDTPTTAPVPASPNTTGGTTGSGTPSTPSGTAEGTTGTPGSPTGGTGGTTSPGTGSGTGQ